MATDKANLLAMQFRRDVGDLYGKTTGEPIVLSDPTNGVAVVDGNEWTKAELEDLLEQAINEYQIRIAGELGGPPEDLGRKLAAALPEYVTRKVLNVQLQNVPGYFAPGYSEVSLPSDYTSYMASVSVANGPVLKNGRYRDPAMFSRIASGFYRELTGVYYTIEGQTLRVISIETGIAGQGPGQPVQTQIEIVYVRTQPAITLVDGSVMGGTDIPLRNHHNPAILTLMKITATRYKAQ